MNIWHAVDLTKISGTATEVQSIETIFGDVEIVPDPEHKCAALVLRPLEWLQREHPLYDVGSNLAFRARIVLSLTKREAALAFDAESGDELTLTRKGWGTTFVHTLRKP